MCEGSPTACQDTHCAAFQQELQACLEKSYSALTVKESLMPVLRPYQLGEPHLIVSCVTASSPQSPHHRPPPTEETRTHAHTHPKQAGAERLAAGRGRETELLRPWPRTITSATGQEGVGNRNPAGITKMSSGLHFTKYHGLGNDFVVIYPFPPPLHLQPAHIRGICHRSFGVGADGVITCGETEKEVS